MGGALGKTESNELELNFPQMLNDLLIRYRELRSNEESVCAKKKQIDDCFTEDLQMLEKWIRQFMVNKVVLTTLGSKQDIRRFANLLTTFWDSLRKALFIFMQHHNEILSAPALKFNKTRVEEYTKFQDDIFLIQLPRYLNEGENLPNPSRCFANYEYVYPLELDSFWDNCVIPENSPEILNQYIPQIKQQQDIIRSKNKEQKQREEAQMLAQKQEETARQEKQAREQQAAREEQEAREKEKLSKEKDMDHYNKLHFSPMIKTCPRKMRKM